MFSVCSEVVANWSSGARPVLIKESAPRGCIVAEFAHLRAAVFDSILRVSTVTAAYLGEGVKCEERFAVALRMSLSGVCVVLD